MFHKNMIGILGIIIALLGVGVAIFQDQLRPPPTPATTQLKEAAIEKGASLLGVKVDKKTNFDWVTATQYGLGFFAIVLGAFSWVRKENHRVSALAAGLGVIAAAWEYFLYGVALAAFILIAGAFS
jgi:hypothetical protein